MKFFYTNRVIIHKIILESYIPCSNDAECVKNSICIGNTVESQGLCTCLKDFIPKKNRTYYECLPGINNKLKMRIEFKVFIVFIVFVVSMVFSSPKYYNRSMHRRCSMPSGFYNECRMQTRKMCL